MEKDEQDELLKDDEARFLWLFAQHVHTIAREQVFPNHTRDKPKTLRFGEVGTDHVFEVRLWHRGTHFPPNTVGDDLVWDQGTVDGLDCGNRSGVIQSFALEVFKRRRRMNEDGAPVKAIYDVNGLLTNITANCDEVSREPLTKRQKDFILGIKSMVKELL